MLEVWLSLKRALQCKPHPLEVHDPKGSMHKRSSQRKGSSKFKRSKSNTEGFIQGSKGHWEKPQNFNPITHEVVLDGSNGEIRSCRCCPCPQSNRGSKGLEGPHSSRRPATPSRITHHHHVDYHDGNISSSNTRLLVQTDSEGPSILICHKCGEKLKNLDAVETHHISEHSVTELEEDSSRQIIETICGTCSINSENKSGQIDCILKVQNMPRTLACFEEYREIVKSKAEKLQKKHPRCLADGNELLRFHGTTIACSLGINSSCSLCALDYCGICQILRHGFPTKEFQGALGVYTTSTSEKAFDSIISSDEIPFPPRKSVIVCRAIAGRIYSPLEEIQERVDSGFDSLAENISCHSDIEELYVLNPKALLPCFAVIYKQQTIKVKRFNSKLWQSF